MLQLFLGLCLAQPVPFGAPKLFGGIWFENRASVVLDVTRDGSPDFFGASAFGIHFVASTDEDGSLLEKANLGWFSFPSPQPGSITPAISFGVGRLDSDFREDAVGVSASGATILFYNAGNSDVSAPFQPHVVLDYFGPSLPLNPPFVNLNVPKTLVEDVNSDGLSDIVIGVAAVDVWAGQTHPGFLYLYENQGGGSFSKQTLPLPGNVIDFEWAALGLGGVKDHFVVVSETGSALSAAYGYELYHAQINAQGTLAFTGNPASLPLRATSVEVSDVLGTGFPDYIVTTSQSNGGGGVSVFEGDGSGALGAWSSMLLPPQTSLFPAFVMSAKVRDFNRDGHADIAVVRHYHMASTMTPQYADAELLVSMGPSAGLTLPTSISMNGAIQDTWSMNPLANVLPMVATPDLLRTADWSSDGVTDLYVSLVTQVSASGPASKVAIFKNQTPVTLGDTGLFKVGEPSGGVAGFPARAGFDGKPVVGNSQFSATIGNLRGGSVVGLVWSPVGIPYFDQAYGVDAHIVAVLWGSAFFLPPAALGQGFGEFPLPIANTPSMLGDFGYFQWAYYDPVAGKFGGTQATQVMIGN